MNIFTEENEQRTETTMPVKARPSILRRIYYFFLVCCKRRAKLPSHEHKKALENVISFMEVMDKIVVILLVIFYLFMNGL